MSSDYGSAVAGAILGAFSAWVLTYLHQKFEDRRQTRKAKQVFYHFIESFLNKVETAQIGGIHGTGDTFKFDLNRHIALCDTHVLGCKNNDLAADYLSILDTLNWGNEHVEGHEIQESNCDKMRIIEKKHKLHKLKRKI